MLLSLSLIFICGLFFSAICKKLSIPNIVGIIFTGILLGPYVLNLFDKSILLISPDLRQIALIIILLKAGLSLNISDLKKVGISATLMSFVPASFEILAFFLFAPYILHINRLEALLMGSVLAAVSPAIVVPRMVKVIEEGYGTKKSIPQLILAGASCDDIFVIVLFSSFLNMLMGNKINLINLFNVPISIILGIILGLIIGYLLYLFFELFYKKKMYIRNSTKVIILLGISFFLIFFEQYSKNIISVSALLAITSMACLLKFKIENNVSKRLAEKFSKLWIAAELILFVLIGCAVDIRYTLLAGKNAVIMIFIALIFRSMGVFISLLTTKLKAKEKLFCIFAYLPKATVQAAIGSIPLSMGLDCGKIILSVAVLSILITAPIGAMLIDITYKKLLNK